MNYAILLQIHKMSRCLVIGDPHIRTKEIEFTDLMLNEIVEIATDRKPDFIVVLGDTLHNNNHVDTNPLCRAVEWLGKLEDIAPLILLIGNHDIKNNKVNLTLESNPEHPFTALKRWKNTTVVDKTTIFEFKGQKFCAVPYVPEGCFHDAIKDINHEELTAFFGHSTIRGVRYRLNEDPVENADVWPDNFKPGFFGHIHEYQVVAPNLIFIGTPSQQDHGADKDKAIAIIDFSGENFEMERIHLKSVPIRSKYEFNSDDIDSIIKLIKELKQSDRIFLVKVVFRGTQVALRALEKSGPYRELKAIKGVVVEPIPTDAGIENTIVETSILPKSLGFLDTIQELYKHNPSMLEIIKELK